MGCGRQGFCKPCQKAYQLAWRLSKENTRRSTARNRLDRALIHTRTNTGLSDLERHFQRLLMAETAMRVRWGWFDRMLKAEEAADPNRPLSRVPKPQNTRWNWERRRTCPPPDET